MKAHRRNKRALRLLALSGCVSALALPAAAGAQPAQYQAPTGASATPAISYHPHGRPAAYAGSTITAGTGQQADALQHSSAYSLPAGFASDMQSGGVPASSAYSLPAGFASDVQSGGVPATSTQTPSVVVREVRTITTGSDDHTLALVLASAALAIALCGSAYAVVRTGRIQRRVLGSNS